MNKYRSIYIVALILSAILCIASFDLRISNVKAESEEEGPVPIENILLNAYLVPLQNAEIRDKMLKACENAEIDLLSHIYVADTWTAEDHTFEKYKALMAEADKYGMKLLARDIDVQNFVNLPDNKIREIARKYKDLPGFGGFFVVDEPYEANPYARVVNILRQECKDASVNVNFLPRGCYPEGEYIRRLTDYGGIIAKNGSLSLDVYTFTLNGGVDEASLFKNYGDLREAGLLTGQNTAVYVQSVGLSGGYRRPSGRDLRYNMMSAIAYGVKEIKFFTWSTPPEGEGAYTEAIFDRAGNPTDLYDEVCKINSKVHKFGTYVALCDCLEVYHSRNNTPGAYDILPTDYFVKVENNADVILSLMKERDGDVEYLMVVNKDFKKTQEVVLSFKNISSVEEIDGGTGKLKSLALSDNRVTVVIDAGDASLFKLPGKHISDKEGSKNLAQGASVRATSSYGTAGLFLYNLTDGSTDGLGARLVSDSGAEQMVTIDIGSVKSMNRIDIYPSGKGTACGQSYPGKFSLQLSEDGKTFKEVVSVNEKITDMSKVPVYRFNETKARYIRIIVSCFDSVNKQADIGEVAAYLDDGAIPSDISTSYVDPYSDDNINVALGKPVVDFSSTTDVPDWNAHHTYINDGDLTKAWASELFRNDKADSPEWITIDLLGEYDIGRVELTPRDVWHDVNVFPADYEIQVSSDAVNFTTVARKEGDNDPQSQDKRIITFEPVTARFIRLYATKLTQSSTAGGGYAIEMNEMEVFCKKKEIVPTASPEVVSTATVGENTTASPKATAEITEDGENKKNTGTVGIIIALGAAVLIAAGTVIGIRCKKHAKK